MNPTIHRSEKNQTEGDPRTRQRGTTEPDRGGPQNQREGDPRTRQRGTTEPGRGGPQKETEGDHRTSGGEERIMEQIPQNRKEGKSLKD